MTAAGLVNWIPTGRRPRVWRRLALALLVPAILTPLALLPDPSAPPLIVNETDSLPRGLYRRLPDGRPAPGAVVALTQPPEARAYLRRLGVPSDMPLIKRVAAAAGDDVCVSDGRLTTPDRSVVLRRRDRAGRPLPAWNGCRRLRTQEILVLGDSARSFDGRYFGPVDRSRVIGVYRVVLTW